MKKRKSKTRNKKAIYKLLVAKSRSHYYGIEKIFLDMLSIISIYDRRNGHGFEISKFLVTSVRSAIYLLRPKQVIYCF